MFTLPPLPYAENALDPVISANTLSFHYGKHHKAYVDNLNNLAKGTEYESAPLEKVIRDTAGKADKMGLFNNSAQVWNHTFYWNCLKGGGGGKPTGRIAQMIDSDLGGYDTFKRTSPTLASRNSARAGDGWSPRRQAEDHEDAQRRACVHQGRDAAADDRRLGARVLPRLPESPARSRQRGDRQAAQLEFRGGKPGARLTLRALV
jgi:hypothetical protein